MVKPVRFDLDEDWEYGWTRVVTGYLLELWHALMFCDDCDDCYMVQFPGPEEELRDHLWDGDLGLTPTSWSTEDGSILTTQLRRM